MNMSKTLRAHTCGEISCDQCNDEREAAAIQLEKLQAENAMLRDKARTLINTYFTDKWDVKYIYDLRDSILASRSNWLAKHDAEVRRNIMARIMSEWDAPYTGKTFQTRLREMLEEFSGEK